MRRSRIDAAPPARTTAICPCNPADLSADNTAWSTLRHLWFSPVALRRVFRLTHGVEVPATPQTVLYPQTLLVVQELTPCLVEFAVKLAVASLVRRVPDETHREEGGPQQEVVESEDRPRVEQHARKAYHCGEDAE